jgi:hypothetical protein
MPSPAPARHQAADAAEPDDAQSVSDRSSRPRKARSQRPAARRRRSARPRGRRPAEGDRQLGGRHVVRLGGVDHQDAAPAGGVEVDVVDAHPAATHDLADAARRPPGGPLVDLGAGAGDQRVVAGDAPSRKLRAMPARSSTVASSKRRLTQRDGVGDEDPEHGAQPTAQGYLAEGTPQRLGNGHPEAVDAQHVVDERTFDDEGTSARPPARVQAPAGGRRQGGRSRYTTGRCARWRLRAPAAAGGRPADG